MQPTDTIQIQVGLDESQRQAAAAIYYDAFSQKLKPIIGEREPGTAVLAADLDLDLVIAAFVNGQLAGIAGFNHDGRKLVNLRFGTLRGEFGAISSIMRYGLAILFDRTPPDDDLLMDGIAVHPDMRGYGIGTRLLRALFAFAHAHHYAGIVLDVIDTNPDARRLYERLGFIPVKTDRFPYLQRLLGFSATTTMRRPITPPDADPELAVT